MLEIGNVRKPKGATHKKRIKGRGHSAGRGKTAGRGHKGQRSRSGVGIPVWFEGGQIPLLRRLPRRGFNNKRFRVTFQVVNLEKLDRFAGGEVTPALLAQAGLVRRGTGRVKILGTGEAPQGVTVRAHAVSASARSKIEAAGGKVEILG